VTAATRLSYLRVALILVGLIFIFGVYPLMMALWPSGWRWSPNQAQYEQMILGVYATLGVFLLIASRNPLRHLSLIWFTVFSSIVHAGIMTVQALRMPSEHGHLFGDVPALFIVAALLAFLAPSGADRAQVSS
jgi:ABC-type transport system involved in cytochrome c biogenesis permease subunit